MFKLISRSSNDSLSILSLAYLLTPVLIFVLGWLRLELAIPLFLLLIWAFVQIVSQGLFSSVLPKIGNNQWFVLAATSFFWAILCGVGGFVFQKGDYDKHNLLFYDLITQHWPVVYQHEVYNQPILCYYLAYYLPTSAVIKVFSLPIIWADSVSFVWGYLGILLSFAWIWRLLDERIRWLVILFLLFGGWHFPLTKLSERWLHFFNHLPYQLSGSFIFSNGEFAHRQELSSFLVCFQWVPQHALGAWVATGLFWANRKQTSSAIWWLVGACLLLWSPFVGIGWGLLVLITNPKILLPTLNHWPIRLAAVLLGSVLLLYFQSHFPLEFAGIITKAFVTQADVWLYLIYWVVQLWGVVYLSKKLSLQTPNYKVQQKTMLICALLMQGISFFYMGKYNDWLMRTIIPAQLIFYITLLNTWAKSSRTWAWWLLSVWLFVCFIYPCRSLAYSLFEQKYTNKVTQGIYYAPTNYNEGNIAHVSKSERFPEVDFSIQYLGRKDSFFYKYLCKKSPTQIAE